MLLLLVIALLPDLGVDTWNPLTSNGVHDTIHLLTSEGFWVHSDLLVWLSNFSEGISQSVHNGSLTATYGTDDHETVTYERGLVKLNDLDEPLWLIEQVVLSHELSDGTLNFLIGLLFDISLSWEDISEKRKEEWDILSDELGQVHISEGTGHNHFLISTWWLGSLGVTGSSEYGKNVSKTEIVVTLLGQLLFAKLVEHIEFLGQWNESGVTDRGELDHDNDSSVGNHHTYTSEQNLEVLWKLLTTSITWVHGNEVSA